MNGAVDLMQPETATQTEKPAREQGLPAAVAVMHLALGAWISQAISTVTRLGIPDLLDAGGAQTAMELAKGRPALARHPARLERALRACASVGIFTEDGEGRFGPTSLSGALTADRPGSVKKFVEMMGSSWWRVWGGLQAAIESGEPQAKAALGMEYWEYCQANPEEMRNFGEAMKANSHAAMQGLLAHCDFSDCGHLVDVGGGLGHLAIALLERYAHLHATVVELPELAEEAGRRAALEHPSLAPRLSFAGGDMFEDMPEADAYVLKHIVHDWDDGHSEQVLRVCRRRMRAGGRVHCVDSVLPPMGETGAMAAKFLDLNMMVFHPGMERTRAQWQALFHRAGLRLDRVVTLDDHFGLSILTAVGG